MRRRITDACTGLGNPSPEVFDNKWTDNKKFNMDLELFFVDVLQNVKDFEDWGGFDFKIDLRPQGFTIKFGIEPAYKHDKYICYCLDSNRENSYIHRGKAYGYYGSDIRTTSVREYDRFTKKYMAIIDKHFDKLLECLDKSLI